MEAARSAFVVDATLLAAAANLATLAAVLIAIVFGFLQLRADRERRKESAAIEAIHSFLTPEFTSAFEAVNEIPEGATAEEIDAMGPTTKNAIRSVAFVGEMLAVMVHRRILPLDVVDDLMGAFIRLAWKRVRPIALRERARLGHSNYMEWYQWLAEQLEAHPVPGKSAGAFEAHRAWKP